jgi:hypothetical protein
LECGPRVTGELLAKGIDAASTFLTLPFSGMHFSDEYANRTTGKWETEFKLLVVCFSVETNGSQVNVSRLLLAGFKHSRSGLGYHNRSILKVTIFVVNDSSSRWIIHLGIGAAHNIFNFIINEYYLIVSKSHF